MAKFLKLPSRRWYHEGSYEFVRGCYGFRQSCSTVGQLQLLQCHQLRRVCCRFRCRSPASCCSLPAVSSTAHADRTARKQSVFTFGFARASYGRWDEQGERPTLGENHININFPFWVIKIRAIRMYLQRLQGIVVSFTHCPDQSTHPSIVFSPFSCMHFCSS